MICVDENSELLLYIYQNAKMGVNSCTELIRILNSKDNKIKKVVEGELKGYESFVKKSEKLMRDYHIEPKDKGIMANLMSKMGMNMEMMRVLDLCSLRLRRASFIIAFI